MSIFLSHHINITIFWKAQNTYRVKIFRHNLSDARVCIRKRGSVEYVTHKLKLVTTIPLFRVITSIFDTLI